MNNPKLYPAYETDASGVCGKPKEVIVPENFAELQRAVRENINITIRGAGTGLAGGAVCSNGIVIDMSKFNKIINFNKERKIIEVEAGIVLDELNEYLDEFGFEFPVNPSSHSVATIGGMIATDAVGSRAIKYGKTSKWVEWIDVVDNEGMVHKKGKTEISDFTGLEGTTGVILRTGLRVIPKPDRTLSIIKKDTIEEIIEIVRSLKRNSNVSMAEFIGKSISSWLGFEKAYYLFVEYESTEGEFSGESYLKKLELRDNIYPCLAEKGYFRIEDPKIFLDKIPELILWLEENKVPFYGHLSVGIIHPCFSPEQENLIKEMMKIVKRLSGQISGEHGIGIIKRDFVDEQDKKLFRLIKERNDSKNKFNPGKIVK